VGEPRRRRLFRFPVSSRARVDADLLDEIDAHIVIGVDELVARGMDRDEAERRVKARFGDFDREAPALLASARRRALMAGRRYHLRALWRDVTYALRQVRGAPLFVAGVVVSLGFGIGAAATVFSWMQGMLLRPLPAVTDSHRLVSVRPADVNGFGISVPEYEEWRATAKSFSDLAAVSITRFSVVAEESSPDAAGNPTYGMLATANYFDVLGIAPAQGRTFTADDDQPGAEPVAVISHALRRRLIAVENRDIVGTTIRVNGVPVRVVGVAPPRFHGNLAVVQFDLWMPISMRPVLALSETETWRNREVRWLDGIGRLAPGIEVAAADLELKTIAQRQAGSFEENRGRSAQVIPLDVGGAKLLTPLFAAIMSVLVLVVTLICANVAQLLLTRGAVRQRELAIRLSLGATRGRIVRQLLTENAILAAAGAVLGLYVASFGETILAGLTPKATIPLGMPPFQLDLPFLVFVIALTAGCVLAFGLAPALIGSRLDPIEIMKNGGRGGTAGRSRARSSLVVIQYAFALATLVCAALVLRWDREMRDIDLGFQGANEVLLAQAEISMAGYRDMSRWSAVMVTATDEIARLPGVRRVALGSFVPLGLTSHRRAEVDVPGQTVARGEATRVLVGSVDDEYFALMGIPLLQGRTIAADDVPGRPAVVVVNQAFAAKYYDGQIAIGRSFRLGATDVTIAGMVRNGRYDFRNIEDTTIPIVYQSWWQAPDGYVAIHVRTDGDPMRHAGVVRETIQKVDPSIVLLAPTTLEEFSSAPFYVSRSGSVVMSVMSAAVLLLASFGLFSVISYNVTLRTQEIGIRMALGAARQRVVGVFLGGAFRLVASGAVAGAVAAIMLVTVFRQLLPSMPAASAADYLVPLLLLSVCALVAGIVPVHRAAGVDPAITLRAE
jgi:predicted permease